MTQIQIQATTDPRELLDAFALFTKASESLEGVHGQLLRQIQHLTQELEAANARLRRKERLAAMGSVAAQLAHEIRNPLNSIALYASLLEENQPESGLEKNWCRQIETSVHMLNTLVCNMLNLASPAKWAPCPLNIHQTLAAVFEFSRSLLESQGIQLKTDWNAGKTILMGEGEQLRQLFLNLVLNAVQAMPDGGWLRVNTRNSTRDETGPRVEISVMDTGEGIDDEHLPMLFEPGFSTHNGGHGLGLWIIGQIVERHQGFIRVSSTRNRGTEFLLSFPIIGDGSS